MKVTHVVYAIVGSLLVCFEAQAHFLVLLPSDDIVNRPKELSLDILFTHPMEQGPVMEMGRPLRFGVMKQGKKTDMRDRLAVKTRQGKTAYTVQYKIAEPADHVFFMEPAPYWEPAEQKMIIHYTKVVVDGLGAEDGWDRLVGLPVEIEPLVRPYGLWAGNVFRGLVRKNGKPVAFAEVEVEYYNQDSKVAIPADPYITQVIKADGNGIFCYAMPKAGWWGFAALVEGDEPMLSPEGTKVAVELGGLLWVKTVEMR